MLSTSLISSISVKAEKAQTPNCTAVSVTSVLTSANFHPEKYKMNRKDTFSYTADNRGLCAIRVRQARKSSSCEMPKCLRTRTVVDHIQPTAQINAPRATAAVVPVDSGLAAGSDGACGPGLGGGDAGGGSMGGAKGGGGELGGDGGLEGGGGGAGQLGLLIGTVDAARHTLNVSEVLRQRP
eukprot:7379641-Prymnesium_polylepis.1